MKLPNSTTLHTVSHKRETKPDVQKLSKVTRELRMHGDKDAHIISKYSEVMC